MEHNSQTKTCQNKDKSKYCMGEFTITPDDFLFYEKMKVPPPTFCPTCRLERRLLVLNTWNVFMNKCSKCGVDTMSMYRKDSNLKVYCQKCWWSDEWDGTEYKMDYDPKRSFLEQWRELQLRTPHAALDSLYLTLVNSEYSNYLGSSKNCYMVFWADYCENVYYSSILNSIKDSSDILRGYKSELCYDSVGIGMCSKTYFSDTCDNCIDVWFSKSCYGCINCIGCINQRNKSYMIFNKKYSREEYFEILKDMNLETRKGIEKLKNKFEEFSRGYPIRSYTGDVKNYNTSGDYIFESKNSSNCYMCIGVENCSNCQFITIPTAKDCYDYSGWGANSTLIYETSNCGEGSSNVKFTYSGHPNIMNIEYSVWCIGGKDNFGCVNLKRKQYAILNKVYSKEEYEKLVLDIKNDMTKNPYIDNKGRTYQYGEFFPPEFSLFPYNDSNAMNFLPKSKEETLKTGYLWKDKIENIYQPTILGKDLPETIFETNESILNEVISCIFCSKLYKISNGEYFILKKLNLPIPNKCPKCREIDRFEKVNKPIFYNFTCQKCKKHVYTANKSKDSIIYCDECFKQEMI
jgi:hypothetical protein